MNLDFISQLNTKKILLIIAFLVVCFGLGFGIYFLFFRQVDIPADSFGNLPSANNLPQVDDGFNTDVSCVGGNCGNLPDVNGVINKDLEKIDGQEIDVVADGGNTQSQVLYAGRAMAVNLSTNGQGVVFYNTDDNKFYVVSGQDGKVYVLDNKEFYNLEDVFWSADGSQAILAYPDGQKVLYNFTTKKTMTLSQEISEAVFFKKDKVAYKYISEDEQTDNWLAVTEINSGQTSLVQSVGENADYVQVSWSPTGKVVAFYNKAQGLDKSEVFFIGLNNENFLSLEVAGTHFRGLWSPSGLRLLYSVVSSQNNYNPSLWVVDADEDKIGQHKYDLGLSTWVDKCVFANETTVYCAVPRQLTKGSGLYPEIMDITSDLIYKINLSNGTKQLLANPVFEGENSFAVSGIFLSTDRSMLFFHDAKSGGIYKIQLK